MARIAARFIVGCSVILALAACAEDFLPGVQRILFLGDSITYDGQYVDDIETALRMQLPTRHFDIINCGLPSETVSGLSEKGHADGKFAAQADQLRLYRSIATMDAAAPLPPLPDQTPTWSAAAALARDWDLNRLADRLTELQSGS